MADNQVYRRRVKIKAEHGLHIRPCQIVAQAAMRFDSRVRLSAGDKKADAKSILDLMGLGAGPNEELDLEVDGPDAPDAMEHLSALFEAGFPLEPSANGQPPDSI